MATEINETAGTGAIATVLSIASRVLASGFSLVLVILLGNSLAVPQFAQFALVESFRVLLASLPAASLGQAYIRGSAHSNAALHATVVLGLALAVVVASVLLILSTVLPTLGWSPAAKYSGLWVPTLAYLVASVFFTLGRHVVIAMESAAALVLFEVVPLLALGLTIAVPRGQQALADLHTALYTLTPILSLPFALVVFRPLLFQAIPSPIAIRQAAYASLNYVRSALPASLLGSTFSIADVPIVLVTSGAAAAAAFKASRIFMTAFQLMAEGYHVMIFPRLSRIANYADRQALTSRTVRNLLACAVVGAILTALAGPTLLDWLYAARYSSADTTLLVMTLALWGPAFSWHRFAGTTLYAAGRPDAVLRASAPTSVVTLTLMFAGSALGGLPGFGAAIAAQAFVGVALQYGVARRMNVSFPVPW